MRHEFEDFILIKLPSKIMATYFIVHLILFLGLRSEINLADKKSHNHTSHRFFGGRKKKLLFITKNKHKSKKQQPGIKKTPIHWECVKTDWVKPVLTTYIISPHDGQVEWQELQGDDTEDALQTVHSVWQLNCLVGILSNLRVVLATQDDGPTLMTQTST